MTLLYVGPVFIQEKNAQRKVRGADIISVVEGVSKSVELCQPRSALQSRILIRRRRVPRNKVGPTSIMSFLSIFIYSHLAHK